MRNNFTNKKMTEQELFTWLRDQCESQDTTSSISYVSQSMEKIKAYAASEVEKAVAAKDEEIERVGKILDGVWEKVKHAVHCCPMCHGKLHPEPIGIEALRSENKRMRDALDKLGMLAVEKPFECAEIKHEILSIISDLVSPPTESTK